MALLRGERDAKFGVRHAIRCKLAHVKQMFGPCVQRLCTVGIGGQQQVHTHVYVQVHDVKMLPEHLRL